MDQKQKTTGGLKILIAEDDELNRMLLCEILEKYGYDYVAAENGKQAVECFQKEIFDVVFLDIQMPMMNGYEAVAKIRELERLEGNRHTPVAALSASALTKEVEKSIHAGMDYHLTKPYFPNEIKQFLEKIEEGAYAGNVGKGTGNGAGNVAGINGKAGMIDGVVTDVAAAGSGGDTIARYYTGAVLQKVYEKADSDMEFFEALIRRFENSSKELLNLVYKAVADQDGAALRRSIHSLRGEFMIFDAQPVYAGLDTLEKMAQSQAFDGASADIAMLGTQACCLVDVFSAFVKAKKQDTAL